MADEQLHAIPADHAVISAYVLKSIRPKLQELAKAKGVSVSAMVGQWINERAK